MDTFPILSSGAVAQYPLPLVLGRPAQVIRFIDGSDQRFAARGTRLRGWQIKLSLLNEIELAQVEAFFEGQSGEYYSFDFPDPISGTTVPNCCFGGPVLSTLAQGTDIGAANFWVVETVGGSGK